MPGTLIHRDRVAIILWLSMCLLLVAGMVFVGGYTRLSGSGLSITEWKPIHGVVPPLNDKEWQEEFEAYKKTPQYDKINRGMTLDEFKIIFWPEYFHRVLGRIIGAVFFIPWLAFALRRSMNMRFTFRLAGIFLLGGLQGGIGWIMVKSGLVDAPFVSPLKLALHLSIAFAIFALILWSLLNTAASLRSPVASAKENLPGTGDRRLGTYFLWFSLLCLQIVFGALVAGSHAGLLYNTWPTMNGAWIPPELSAGGPWLENPALIQFIHRTLAVLVALGFPLWWYNSCAGNSRLCRAIFGVILLQFGLGVLTLLHLVPLPLALAHQMAALLLFALAVALMHNLAHVR